MLLSAFSSINSFVYVDLYTWCSLEVPDNDYFHPKAKKEKMTPSGIQYREAVCKIIFMLVPQATLRRGLHRSKKQVAVMVLRPAAGPERMAATMTGMGKK